MKATDDAPAFGDHRRALRAFFTVALTHEQPVRVVVTREAGSIRVETGTCVRLSAHSLDLLTPDGRRETVALDDIADYDWIGADRR